MGDLTVDEISYDYVVLCGQRVERPPRIARSAWLQFWESIVRVHLRR